VKERILEQIPERSGSKYTCGRQELFKTHSMFFYVELFWFSRIFYFWLLSLKLIFVAYSYIHSEVVLRASIRRAVVLRVTVLSEQVSRRASVLASKYPSEQVS